MIFDNVNQVQTCEISKQKTLNVHKQSEVRVIQGV